MNIHADNMAERGIVASTSNVVGKNLLSGRNSGDPPPRIFAAWSTLKSQSLLFSFNAMLVQRLANTFDKKSWLYACY